MNVELVRIGSEVKNTRDIGEAVLLADRFFVMGRRPSQIHTVMDIEIPRPRDRRPRDRNVLVFPTVHEYVRNIRQLLVADPRPV